MLSSETLRNVNVYISVSREDLRKFPPIAYPLNLNVRHLSLDDVMSSR